MIISILVALGGIWIASQSRSTADQSRETAEVVDALLGQYVTDQNTTRLATCRARNSAQQAARADASRRVEIALGGFADGVAALAPDYAVALAQIEATAIATANEESTPFFDIDTDCNGDGFFTLDDYESVSPDFSEGPVAFPNYREPPPPVPGSTSTTTTQPGG